MDIQLEEIAKIYLETWPLYEKTHRVSSGKFEDGKIWLSYKTLEGFPAIAGASWEKTHFDVNIIDDVFYVLGIGLTKEHRGKGHGDALYRILENIARDAGCKKIQMNPSGKTQTGETRKDYLLRRGYKESGIEVYKDLIFEYEFKVGERVCGDVLFGEGLRLEGVIIKQEANISRDAVVVELNDGNTAVMLSNSLSRI